MIISYFICKKLGLFLDTINECKDSMAPRINQINTNSEMTSYIYKRFDQRSNH